MVLQRSALILSVACLSACANNTMLYNPPAQTMSLSELNYFHYDCQHAAEQRLMLEHQLRNIPPGDTSTARRGIILNLLRQMRDDCPAVTTPTLVGCTHVREDLTKGSAQATICNNDPNRGLRPLERPVINRWDPLVDTK